MRESERGAGGRRSAEPQDRRRAFGEAEERLGRHDLRLLPAALSAWAAALWLAGRPGAAVPLAWAAGAAALLLCARLLVRRGRTERPSRTIAPQLAWCCAVVCLVAAGAAWQLRLSGAESLQRLLGEEGRASAIATITGPVDAAAMTRYDEQPAAARHDPWRREADAGPVRIRLELVEAAGGPGGSARVRLAGLCFCRVSGEAPAAIGTRILVSGRLRIDGNGPVLLFAHRAASVLAPPGAMPAWAHGLREGLAAAAAELPEPGGRLVPGLATGDTRALDERTEQAMRIASLAHLTAVSGANCAIVVGGILLAGRLLRVPRTVRALAAGAGLAGFVLLVTPEGSVLRAGVMAAIALGAGGWGRAARGVPLLLLAATVLLAADPGIADDAGFALSVLATAGLLLLAEPLALRLARVLPRWLAVALAVPLAAQLACQPVLLLLQEGLPLYGAVANLLAAPAAPLATVLGLLACLLLPVAPWAAEWPLRGAWLAAQWIGAVAHGVAGWPAATLPWWPGALGALAFALVVLAAGVLLLTRARRLRAPVALGLCLLLAVAAGTATGSALHRARDRPGQWRAAACDVGQGDAILVRAGGPVALIDTGEEPGPLERCLRELGVEALAWLLLSHFDRDHSGAALEILPRIGGLIVPDTVEARGEPVLEQVRAAGVPVRYAAAGDVWRLGDTVWTALWPVRRAGGAPSPESGNDGSLAVRVDPAPGCLAVCRSLVSLGDLSARPQTALRLRSPRLLPADVVKMSHHGSRDQDPQLYLRIGARLGLVSAGAGNGYGHPTGEALGMLADAGCYAARTDLLGTIVVHERDGRLAIWTSARDPPDGAVRGG
ncbi:MAG: ComEC/Rec2 family competence protein [Pseudoclavibacter sp.]|nr:ComEC/Rec2 family competence protein [Pseudoclavibacter sp.]